MMKRRQFLTLTGFVAMTQGLRGAYAATDGEEPFPISLEDATLVAPEYRRKRVAYDGKESPGSIIIDTANRFLYLVEPDGRAMRYGIGVGRQGFSWSGRAIVRWKAQWPRWTPPAEMVARDPLAAKWANGMPGGPENPLGARALYLFQGEVDTLYRIHGTFDPQSIGRAVSSGCIRLLNVDVVDLYQRARIGAPVIVHQGGTTTVADGQPRRKNKPRVIDEQPRKKFEPRVVVRRNFNLN